ncbi:MAG: sigma-70 family RNA polymerase sigma factor [Bacteroidales bacterium]|nr:sigma-70 family RNA polymerase sigma factor [Bacteroidales bacterium]
MTKKISYKSTIDIYKNELKTRKPLTVEQEREIGHRIAAGDEAAIAELVEANTRYAFNFAHKFNFGIVPFEDLIEAANLGLVIAAQRFDVSYGNRFLTFANKWMYKYIIELVNQEKKSTNTCDVDGNYFKHNSLDACFKAEEDGCLYDVLEDENSKNLEEIVCQSLDFKVIMNHRHILTDREYEVLVRYFGLLNNEPETLDSIGKSFNISREAIRQTKEQALKKIRKQVTYTQAA